MNEEEWGRVLAAYRRGLAADMIQLQDAAGAWGVVWTIPPCSPAAMEQTARLAVRCRAARGRHIRRARLWPRGDAAVDVVVVTEALPVFQVVRDIHVSRSVVVGELLQDDGLRSLLNAVADNVCSRW